MVSIMQVVKQMALQSMKLAKVEMIELFSIILPLEDGLSQPNITRVGLPSGLVAAFKALI